MRPVARIAQSVEQGIENPRVRGSIPRPGTNILKTQPLWLGFCFSGLVKVAGLLKTRFKPHFSGPFLNLNPPALLLRHVA